MAKAIRIEYTYVCTYTNTATIYLEEGETEEDVIKEIKEKGISFVLYGYRRVKEDSPECLDCYDYELKFYKSVEESK